MVNYVVFDYANGRYVWFPCLGSRNKTGMGQLKTSQ